MSNAKRKIGFLHSGSNAAFQAFYDEFKRGLKDGGFVDGKDVTIESRWGDGEYAMNLAAKASELVKLHVELIAAAGGAITAEAAVWVTKTIPVIFLSGVEPAKVPALAASNATGVVVGTTKTVPDRVARLRQLIMPGTRIAVFLRKDTSVYHHEYQMAEQEGLIPVEVPHHGFDVDTMFTEAHSKGAGAIVICADPSFTNKRAEIIRVAAARKVPVAYPSRVFAEDGGLMSYGPNLHKAHYRVGLIAAVLLTGPKRPSDLPAIHTSDFAETINLKAAHSLELPYSDAELRALADDVIP
jgi:putative ABC transport system substrate-binding protein